MHDIVRQSAILAARQAKFLMNELRKTTEGNIHCATMAVPRARVLDLMKVSVSLGVDMHSSLTPQASCRVFNTTYNPERVRIGSHIMHQRLKGASVASYYPPRIGTIAQLRSLYPQHELTDDAEEDWLEHLNVARSRGKAVPKKKRTAAGAFAGFSGEPGAIADNLQSRRSTTRGSKRTPATRYPLRDAVYQLYKRASDGVHLAREAPEIYRSQKRNHIHHQHARMPQNQPSS
jgi:small subunit ribosomal protein S33